MMLAAAILLAHSFYPSHCCNGEDCRPVPCNEINFMENYVFYRGLSGMAWSVYPSPDGACHVCTSTIMLRCVFVPERMS